MEDTFKRIDEGISDADQKKAEYFCKKILTKKSCTFLKKFSVKFPKKVSIQVPKEFL